MVTGGSWLLAAVLFSPAGEPPARLELPSDLRIGAPLDLRTAPRDGFPDSYSTADRGFTVDVRVTEHVNASLLRPDYDEPWAERFGLTVGATADRCAPPGQPLALPRAYLANRENR